MAYIGQSPSVGEFRKLDDISGLFNDSNTTFALTVNSSSVVPGSEQALLISIDGVLQEPGTAYFLSGTNLVFTAAPNTSSTFFGVQLGSVGQVGVPTDGTVTTTKLAANAVTLAKIATNAVDTGQLVNDAVTSAKIINGAVTGDKLDTDAVTTAKILDNSVTTAKILDDSVTTAKIPDSNITAAKLNISSDVSFGGANLDYAGLGGATVSSSSNVVTLNFQTAASFSCNLTEASALTPNNVPVGGCVMILKLENGGDHTVTYAGNVKFAANTAPTLTASGLDYLFFICDSDDSYLVTAQTDVTN
jgi:hypothetical protein